LIREIQQIFRTIFAHLTTSILAIGNYIIHNNIPRSQVGEVSIFRQCAEQHHATLSEKATKSYKIKADAGKLLPLKKKAVKFLEAVGWSESNFVSAYGACFSVMGEKHITGKERLSKDLSQRILAMSGLSWNSDSKNKPRDWERYASAVAVETALVQLYRKKLLLECAPARALRNDLWKLFISWSTNRAEIRMGGTAGLKIVQRWEFADNIDVEEDATGEQSTDLDFGKMRTEWEASQGTGGTGKGSKKAGKAQKDSIEGMLEKIKSNKLLHCSDPEVSAGTLESLSAFAISILGHVK